MAKNVEIIIDGVHHKLVKTKHTGSCAGCSVQRLCDKSSGELCRFFSESVDYIFNKVE